MLTLKFGAEGYATRTLEITWSERLSVFLHKISPLLLGLGLLAIYIEFKTPGFGVFGVTGISLLALVFLGNYVAGLSGHEPIRVFGAGLLLIVIEVFFFPGIAVMALTGLVLIITSLIWSMADIWPNEPLDFRGEMFVGPIQNLGLGIMLAAVFALLLARFIPQGWFFSRLAVAGAVDGSAQVGGGDPAVGAELASLVGRMGVAATGLFPSGQVEIDGRRYEARLEVGHAPTGTRIVVRGKTDFSLIVDRAPPLS